MTGVSLSRRLALTVIRFHAGSHHMRRNIAPKLCAVESKLVLTRCGIGGENTTSLRFTPYEWENEPNSLSYLNASAWTSR